MRTAVDRLRFAVHFAEENLDHFREWEWSKLRADVATFLYGMKGEAMPHFGGLVIQATEPPFPSDYPEGKLRELQADVRGILRGIAPTLGGEDVCSGRRVTITQEWMPMRLGAHIVLQGAASVRDGVLFLLVLLLAQHGLENIRRCPASGCGRLFWKVRRQLYCSRTCVNRENMRTWTRKKRLSTPQPVDTGAPRRRTGRPIARVRRKGGQR